MHINDIASIISILLLGVVGGLVSFPKEMVRKMIQFEEDDKKSEEYFEHSDVKTQLSVVKSRLYYFENDFKYELLSGFTTMFTKHFGFVIMSIILAHTLNVSVLYFLLSSSAMYVALYFYTTSTKRPTL